MKTTILKPVLASIIALHIFSMGMSQSVKLGVGSGVSAYFGDLIYTQAFFQQVSPSMSADLSVDLSSRFRARLNIAYVPVQGDDKKSVYWPTRNRNLNFKSDVWEVSTLAEFDLFNTENVMVTPYLFGGPGVFFFNPTTVDRFGNKVQLKQIGTQGQEGTFALLMEGKGASAKLGKAYNTSEVCLVSGLGFRVQVNDLISVGAEVAYRFTNTDNLDDVSARQYPDKNSINEYAYQLAFRGDELNPNAKPGLQPRGNPDIKDSYYSVQVRVTYNLGLGGGSRYRRW
ncbi:MAG: hypothetical protein JNK08_06610 [Sediminibacterium sp.]|nr:hypothetical protein [Sediminibacterium sp.]